MFCRSCTEEDCKDNKAICCIHADCQMIDDHGYDLSTSNHNWECTGTEGVERVLSVPSTALMSLIFSILISRRTY